MAHSAKKALQHSGAEHENSEISFAQNVYVGLRD